jgi:hypothetical protein
VSHSVKNKIKLVKKLSKSCHKVVKKMSQSCQKVVKKLLKSCPKSFKKLSKSWQKVQNSTNSGGWVGGVWGGEIVAPRPSASASLTGQRQKGQKRRKQINRGRSSTNF